MAVALLTAPLAAHADDKPVPDGYSTVKVDHGGKTSEVLVKKQFDPFNTVKNSSSSNGKYDPERLFSRGSTFSDKSFSLENASFSHNGTALEGRDSRSVVTKFYTGDNSAMADRTTPNLNTTIASHGAAGYDKTAGFDKNFATTGADMGQNHHAVLGQTENSEYQDRAALLGGPAKPEIFKDNDMAHKQYLGPGAQYAPKDMKIKENITLSRMSTVPDRPLSIDEVRELINHDTKPNLDEPPAAPSKPLNDPNYQPEPLRDMPAPARDEDSNDPVPAPGMMATPMPPENAEPLPKP